MVWLSLRSLEGMAAVFAGNELSRGDTPWTYFSHKTPEVYGISFILNCAPKVGHNIKYYER